ncbi:hypothetical protein LIER_14687 [Lithospermum erythrorhizon]|uniref:ZF-HD dimerization-type domain-containing protein n=1 Tax=Lithospermum erythrorhizon TaxID=34254 RepID=A0AAV3Q016_LITER
MEFEHHEEQEEASDDIMLTPNYDDSQDNSCSTQINNNKMLQSQLINNMDISSQVIIKKQPKYKECLKNHAVGLGTTAVDGCGEFMAAGEEGSLAALKCAACNCHRNFHRKETDPAPLLTSPPQMDLPFGFHHFTPPFRATPHGHPHVGSSRAHQPLLLLPSSSGGGRVNSQELFDDFSNLDNSMGSGSLKKRHRTKFSQEQKEKMLELAERLGWRMQKADEEIVQQFCNELGIKRHVLKVWMHNNKHTISKKEGTTPPQAT